MKKYLIIIFYLIGVVSTLAQLSPGDLSNPHRHLEGLKNCTKCHEIGEKVQPDKCLDCHALLKTRIKENLGLHARTEFKNCVECHSDHQGREFNLIWWKEGIGNFDHSKTGYSLEGKHRLLECRACHNSDHIAEKQKYVTQKKDLNRTYLGLDKDCISCHQDEHRGQLSVNCVKCHNLDAWKPAPYFNHNQTRFSLTGKHLFVDCILCHKRIKEKTDTQDKGYLKFKGLKFSACSDCHHDPHSGRLGTYCKKCHSVNSWKGIANQNFDHDQTRFPLVGLHRKVSCNQCHRTNRSLKNLEFNRCSFCHTDYHRGQFSHRQQKGECKECHTEEGFLPSSFTVEQHNLGRYPLQGAHLAVPCNLCHPKGQNGMINFRFSSTYCQTCHRDPHKKGAEQYLSENDIGYKNDVCEYCHTVNSWGAINFDHSKTNFPLSGKHQSVLCKSCHTYTGPDPDILVVLKINKNECQECHQDIHAGQFKSSESDGSDNTNFIRCEKCHTTANWRASNFDHNIHSKFKLEGAHKSLKCSQCHKTVNENGVTFIRYKPINTSCSSIDQ